MFKLLLLAALAGAQDESVTIKKLGECGLVTRYASSQIGETCLTEAHNVYLDEDAGISRRKGFSAYNSTALTDTKSVRGSWNFRATGGTEYEVVLSSKTMYSSTGDGTFAAITGLNNFSATQDMDCTSCLGRFWCVNGSDTMFYWDGSSTATVSGAPTCSAIDCFRNRVALTNCSGSQSQLRLSGEIDGTDYTIPSTPVSTSPVALSIGGVNDGNRVNCLMGVYQDVLMAGKNDSTYGLYGFDRRDFVVREISREVGCIENRSGREKQGSLYWMSKRGIEKMTGPNISRVSDPIRDLVDTVIGAAGDTRGIIDTSQADFQAGNLTFSGAGAPMSATISAGNVVVSTFGVTDTQFASGTLTNLSSTTIANKVTFSSSAFIIENGDFEVSGSTYTNWTCYGRGTSGDAPTEGTCEFLTTGCPQGSNCVRVRNESCSGAQANRIVIYDAAGGASLTYFQPSSAAGTTVDLYALGYSTRSLKIGFRRVCTSGNAYEVELQSPSFLAISSLTWVSNSVDNDETYWTGIDNIRTNRYFSVAQSSAIGTFQSQVFDTGLSTTIGGPFTASLSSSNHSGIVFQVRSASSSSGDFNAYTNISLDTKIPEVKRYYQYLSTFSVLSATATPASLTSVGLRAATTGYFVSQCLNIGTSISSWGLFQCNQATNSGSLSLEISTGSTCNSVAVATAPWTTQVNNSVLSVSTSAYLAYRRLFTIDSSSQTPTHNDCTINWSEGSSRPSVVAEVYKDRYHLAYTSSTTGTVVNDHILVLDSRDQWTLHDAPNCASLNAYKRKLYCGDSGSTGKLFLMDVGSDDNGSSFLSKIKTKDFDFGNAFQLKKLSRIFYDIAGSPDPGYSITLTPSYTLDASTDTFSLDTISLNEDYSRFIAAKVPADLSKNVTGRWLSFGVQNSGSQGPWKLFGLKVSFSRLKED